jgi:hypothetical protein
LGYREGLNLSPSQRSPVYPDTTRKGISECKQIQLTLLKFALVVHQWLEN